MKNLKTLLSVLLAVCMVASLCVTAFATEQEEPAAEAQPLVDTENNAGIIDMTHLDVKADAKYVAVVDGEEIVLDATLVPETIVVTVKTANGPINYKFADYNVFTTVEAGRTEYRIILDVTDGAALNLIQWNGFHMNNVYVGARFMIEEVPEVLADEIEQDEDGNYYIDVADYRYTGIQECTSHNGLRSEGNRGVISGLDLYITASGLVIETPEETTAPEETTVPEETTAPEETTVPGESSTPDNTKPGETVPPTDNVPDTGDHSNNGLLVALMAVSAFGMVATLVLGHKMKYTGKWE